jgi:hypothetical protein
MTKFQCLKKSEIRKLKSEIPHFPRESILCVGLHGFSRLPSQLFFLLALHGIHMPTGQFTLFCKPLHCLEQPRRRNDGPVVRAIAQQLKSGLPLCASFLDSVIRSGRRVGLFGIHPV